MLDSGHTLIIFPEGTRGKETLPGSFKAGLQHLACGYPQAELVPVYPGKLLTECGIAPQPASHE